MRNSFVAMCSTDGVRGETLGLRVSAPVVLLLVVSSACGCQMAGFGYRPSPLNYAQQQQEIEKIAPLGTPRAEVERKLSEAGIAVSPGNSKRIAYCDLWDRAEGGRWMMNVALLFDESGKLVEMRPAQSETGIYSGPVPQTSTANETSLADAGGVERRDPPISDPAIQQASAEQPASVNPQRLSNPADRRIPFEEAKPAYAP